MAAKVKPPREMQKPPEAGPRPPRFKIREVKTDGERKAFDRIVMKELGWDRRTLDRYDGYHQSRRRFVACLLEGEPGRIIATGMLAFNSWKEKYSLSRIAVEEEFRFMGVASAMGARITEEAVKLGLNEIIGFCAKSKLNIWTGKSGFRAVENIGREPGDEEDTYLIAKKLD